ncbi:MAG: hypothetical protein ACRDY2_08815 [Acidimicrobiales bacterium]
MRDAYPIHPELFARLHEYCSALERFHRTRGVLRQHLTALVDARVEITLEIQASPDGFNTDVVRAVGENARTLGFARLVYTEGKTGGLAVSSVQDERSAELAAQREELLLSAQAITGVAEAMAVFEEASRRAP